MSTTHKMASSHSQTGRAFPHLESPLSTSPPTSSYHPPLPPSFHPLAFALEPCLSTIALGTRDTEWHLCITELSLNRLVLFRSRWLKRVANLHSRARSQFQAEYIDRYSDDELSDKVKGAVVWKEHEGVEGYFLFHPNTQKYRQVHYLEDIQQWAYIDYSAKKGQWYTISIVPQALGVGPLITHTTPGIAIDDDSSSPSISVPTTNLPTIDPTTHFQTHVMSQTLQASASTTLTGGTGGSPGASGSGGGAPNPPSGGTSVPPSGGGGGGGGGGGAAPGGAAPAAPAPGGNG
ncbi:hypothetical protein EDB86DRAFT_3086162 [Lactarius hatsudake]|nr:hypothetical protein EDB86DRAFT_3086162 [Lactarius hatsudake]